MKIISIRRFILFCMMLTLNVQLVCAIDRQQGHHEIIDMNRMKLLKAIKLVAESNVGTELKPLIDELFHQDKIHVKKLQKGHYGESGEGCIIINGKYHYEGLFILLNDTLSTEELAVSLVHEMTHYRMIKDFGRLKFEFPVKVITFEITSFATQHQFISELEKLKLIDPQNIFSDDPKNVLEIMQNAFNLGNNWTEENYNQVVSQLVDYGYPVNELNRVISQLSEEHCAGWVES